MDDIKKFALEKIQNIKAMGKDSALKKLGLKFYEKLSHHKYSYVFSWMGRPIIQIPQDIVAMQELIWKVKPDLIIETGIAHGGSLIFYASILELLGKGEVLGIDIDIREHNKKKIVGHKMFKRIKMIEGSSIDSQIVERVAQIVKKHKKIMVCLDSLHTHTHVLKELNLYSKFVSKESYLVVFDTIIEYMPKEFVKNRPWGLGNNSKTAAIEFLKNNKNFIIDHEIEDKLLITSAPNGFLKKIK